MPKFLSNIEYNNNGFTTFNLLFDSNGNYTFDIYNRDKNSTKNTFDHLLKYNINVKKKQTNWRQMKAFLLRCMMK